MLRTAFLVYVRVLLCLQGLFLVVLPWLLFSARGGTALWPMIALGLPVALIGLATIATAVMLRRGRRRAAVAAIMIEAVWAVAACAVVLEALRTSVDAFEYGGSGTRSAAAAWRLCSPWRRCCWSRWPGCCFGRSAPMPGSFAADRRNHDGSVLVRFCCYYSILVPARIGHAHNSKLRLRYRRRRS